MSLLHYGTYKVVVIRDKRLGALYYAIATLILFYTLMEIFVMKGYLEYDESPKGTMRILVSDHRDDPDTTEIITTPHLPPYCCNKEDTGKESKKRRKFCASCEAVDAQDLSWPVESQVLSLTTFCKDRWQVKNRNDSLQHQNFVNVRERKYYTLNPEDIRIKIEHSILATHFSRNTENDEIAASQRSLSGFLYDTRGNIIKSMSNNGVKKYQRGQADKLTVRELLSAADVTSLDEMSDAVNAKGKSFRRHGIVLHVVIGYHNAERTWLGTGPIEYSYHVRRIPYADYRINQIIPVINKDVFNALPHEDNTEMEDEDDHHPMVEKRLFRKRYGIKIEFYQSGRLGRFSFSSLLLKLVAGVGLLTLTATIVDLAALYFLPDRLKYRRYVYEESPLIRKNISEEKGKTE